jgi:hypothetical protein
VGLERGPLNLVRIIEELLEWKSSVSGLEIREYGRGEPLRWPRDTFYRQKLVLTSPTSGGRSLGIVLLRTEATKFFLSFQVDFMDVKTKIMRESNKTTIRILGPGFWTRPEVVVIRQAEIWKVKYFARSKKTEVIRERMKS